MKITINQKDTQKYLEFLHGQAHRPSIRSVGCDDCKRPLLACKCDY